MEGNVVSFCNLPPYSVPPMETNASTPPAEQNAAGTSAGAGTAGASGIPNISTTVTPGGISPAVVSANGSSAGDNIRVSSSMIPSTSSIADAFSSSTLSTGFSGGIPTSASLDGTGGGSSGSSSSRSSRSSCCSEMGALGLGLVGQPRRVAMNVGDTHVSDLNVELEQQLQTIEGVHAVFSSRLMHLPTQPDVPDPKVVTAVAGTGLAPWEIHRPQKFVRDLVLRRCFSGRVLDAGCGIGDNALYVAKACPGAEVIAVDVVPRCLDFASTKAGMRGMRGKVTLIVADLRHYDKLPAELRSQPYDVVLDSYTFHGFTDADRECYVATLARLLRAGGLLLMSCMSEEETKPGGPRRITIAEMRSLFEGPAAEVSGGSGGCSGSGSGSCVEGRCWQLEEVQDSITELHPTFWGGQGKARVYSIRRL